MTSFSGLFRELRINRNFIAVGDEGLPLEIMKKRQAPSSNSSSDSVKDVRSRRKKQNRKREEMGKADELFYSNYRSVYATLATPLAPA